MADPIRTCIGCRRTAPAKELTRLIRQPDGTVIKGLTLDGRGAWLCRGSARCLNEATKRRAFARAFRAPITAVVVDP